LLQEDVCGAFKLYGGFVCRKSKAECLRAAAFGGMSDEDAVGEDGDKFITQLTLFRGRAFL